MKRIVLGTALLACLSVASFANDTIKEKEEVLTLEQMSILYKEKNIGIDYEEIYIPDLYYASDRIKMSNFYEEINGIFKEKKVYVSNRLEQENFREDQCLVYLVKEMEGEMKGDIKKIDILCANDYKNRHFEYVSNFTMLNYIFK